MTNDKPLEPGKNQSPFLKDVKIPPVTPIGSTSSEAGKNQSPFLRDIKIPDVAPIGSAPPKPAVTPLNSPSSKSTPTPLNSPSSKPTPTPFNSPSPKPAPNPFNLTPPDPVFTPLGVARSVAPVIEISSGAQDNYYNDTSEERPYSGNGIIAFGTMTIGTIVSHIVALYSTLGVSIFLTMVIVYLPVIIASSMLFGMAALRVGPEIMLLGNLVVVPLQGVTPFLLSAALAGLVTDAFLKKEVSLWDSIEKLFDAPETICSAAFGTWICSILYGIVVFVVVLIFALCVGFAGGLTGFNFLGFIVNAIGTFGLCILAGPGFIAIMVSPTVSMVEGKGWFEATRRAWTLVFKDYSAAARVAFITIVVWICILVMIMIPTFGAIEIVRFVLGGTEMYIVAKIASALIILPIMLLLVPVLPITLTLLYYDHRIRYERLTLGQLSKELQRE